VAGAVTVKFAQLDVFVFLLQPKFCLCIVENKNYKWPLSLEHCAQPYCKLNNYFKVVGVNWISSLNVNLGVRSFENLKPALRSQMIKNITAFVTSQLEKIAKPGALEKNGNRNDCSNILLCVQSIWNRLSLGIGVWVLVDIAGSEKSSWFGLLLMVSVFVLSGVYNAIFRYVWHSE